MEMLERLDTKRIFACAEQMGADYCELFAEQIHSHQTQFNQSLTKQSFSLEQGLEVSIFVDGHCKRFSCNEPTTESILARLQETTLPPEQCEPSAPCLTELFTELFTEKEIKDQTWRLRQIVLKAWPSQKPQTFQSLTTLQTVRVTCLVDSNGKKAHDEERSCRAEFCWLEDETTPSLRRHFTLWSTDCQSLIAQLEQTPVLRNEIAKYQRWSNPWPAPQGELPLLWSSNALAKLCSKFLQGFEADRVLQNASFLNHVGLPLEIPFSIEELPHGSFDCEGTAKRKMVLFDGNKPRALACDIQTANQMNVEPTGHSRRQSMHQPPTIGLWSPQLHGSKIYKDLSQKLEWGLDVGDVEILQFDVLTGDIELELLQVALIHQGQTGEAVEPIRLKTNLIGLFKRLEGFSDKNHNIALAVTKKNQQLITYLTVPTHSCTLPLPVPGSVPIENYW